MLADDVIDKNRPSRQLQNFSEITPLGGFLVLPNSVWVFSPSFSGIFSLLFYLAKTHAESLFRAVVGTLAACIAFLVLLNITATDHLSLYRFKGFFRNDCIMMVLNLKPLSLPLIDDMCTNVLYRNLVTNTIKNCSL